MAVHTFDLPSFQAACPALAPQDPVALAATFGVAVTSFTDGSGNDTCLLSGAQMQLALNLLTGHMTALANTQKGGAGAGLSGPITGATQGSVSVTAMPPPVRDMWSFWLAGTPYGTQLLGLLQMLGAGGLLIGGSLERASFRGAGGAFGGGVFC